MNRVISRAGAGILLILVVTLAFVLFVAGVSQLFFSSQVYRQTARGSGGLTAEYLAKSAVEELYHKVQAAACDPSHPMFKRLREILLKGEEGADFDGLIDLSAHFHPDLLTRSLDSSAHRSFYRLFVIEEITVLAGVDRSRQELANLVLKLGATARLSIGPRTVSRRVEETRQAGLLLAAPKRPLDQVAFLVLKNPFLDEFGRMALRIREAALLYQRIVLWTQQWKLSVEGKPSGERRTVAVALPGSNRTVQITLTQDPYTFDGLWQPLSVDPTKIETLPEHAYLVAIGDKPVHLAAYDHESSLAQGIEPEVAKIAEAATRLDRAIEMLAAADGREFPYASHAAWEAQMTQVGQKLRGVLETLVGEFIRVSTEIKPHVKSLPDLDGFQLDAQGRLGPPLYPVAYHLQTPKALDELLGAHRRINAHLAYQGDEPLKLDRLDVKGKLTLSSERAPIEVSSFVVGSRDEDLILLCGSEIVFKGGTIDAGVIVRERARFKTEPMIRGCLVLEHLPRRRDRSMDCDLKGTIVYNPKLYSGRLAARKDAKDVLWTHYALGFSPVPEEMEILWKE